MGRKPAKHAVGIDKTIFVVMCRLRKKNRKLYLESAHGKHYKCHVLLSVDMTGFLHVHSRAVRRQKFVPISKPYPKKIILPITAGK